MELQPCLLLARANVLVETSKAYYPVHTLRLKSLLRVLGPKWSLSTMHSMDQFQNGFLYLVKNIAFVGSASTNQLQFQHCDITNLVLYVNGVQHPSEPLTMDCSSPLGATIVYGTLYSSRVFIKMTVLTRLP